MGFLDFAWWVYAVMSLTIFLSCLSLNYILKMYNESRLDEISTRVDNKTSVSQSTQAHGPLIEIETRKMTKLPLISNRSNVDSTSQKKSLTKDVHNVNIRNENNKSNVDHASVEKNIIDRNEINNPAMIPIDDTTAQADDVIVQPSFLGTIYNKDSSTATCDTVKNRDEDRDSISSNINDKIIVNDCEAKPVLNKTASLKKCNLPQNDDDIQ